MRVFKKSLPWKKAFGYSFFFMLFYLCTFDVIYNIMATFKFEVYAFHRLNWQILMWSGIALGYLMIRKFRNEVFILDGFTIAAYMSYTTFLAFKFIFLSPYYVEYNLAASALSIQQMYPVVLHSWISRTVQFIVLFCYFRNHIPFIKRFSK
jgi:hypothetical protein